MCHYVSSVAILAQVCCLVPPPPSGTSRTNQAQKWPRVTVKVQRVAPLPCMCSMVCAVPGHQSMLAGPPFQGVRMTLGTPGEVDRNLTL